MGVPTATEMLKFGGEKGGNCKKRRKMPMLERPANYFQSGILIQRSHHTTGCASLPYLWRILKDCVLFEDEARYFTLKCKLTS